MAIRPAENQDYRQYQGNQDEPNDSPQDHIISIFVSHTNINSMMFQSGISLQKLRLHVGSEPPITLPVPDKSVIVENSLCYKNFLSARKSFEKYIIDLINQNNAVTNLITIGNGGINIVAQVISEAIINSFKNRLYYKQWTETNFQKGMNFCIV